MMKSSHQTGYPALSLATTRRETETAQRAVKVIKIGIYEGPVLGAIPHDVEVKFLVESASRAVQFSLMQTIAWVLIFGS